jgi:hypothetical protein
MLSFGAWPGAFACGRRPRPPVRDSHSTPATRLPITTSSIQPGKRDADMSQGEWSMRRHLEVLEKVRRREPAGPRVVLTGDRMCAAEPLAARDRPAPTGQHLRGRSPDRVQGSQPDVGARPLNAT